jgi:transposase-like protein
MSAAIAKNARITGPARDKLAKQARTAYKKGQSIRDIAESMGRSYGFVHGLLAESDVALRGRGGAQRTKTKRTK